MRGGKATLVPAFALTEARDVRELEEVVKIFELLTSELDVTDGDGHGSDGDCIFTQDWYEALGQIVTDKHGKLVRSHKSLDVLAKRSRVSG
jgi:hypothetical protein